MRNYEFVYIISPEVEKEDLESVTGRVEQMIADGGGQVLRLDSWGRRRLAYPIQRFREGHYMAAQVQLEPYAISELRSKLALTEHIIRYLLVRTEEREEDRLAEEPYEEPAQEEAAPEPDEWPLEEEPEEAEEEEVGG